MAYRTLTGKILASSGGAALLTTVKLVRDRTGWTPDGVYVPDITTLVADANGNLIPGAHYDGPTEVIETIERAQIWASEGSDRLSTYRVVVGGETVGQVLVPEGVGPIELQDLLTVGVFEGSPQYETLQAWIEANTELLAGPKGDPGLEWQGAWNGATAYVVGDVVESAGSAYVAVADHTGSEPPSANWELLAEKGGQGDQGLKGDKGDPGDPGAPGADGDPGLEWRGTWDSGTAYVANDGVEHSGRAYIALQGSTNEAPDPGGTAFWDLLADKGADGAGAGDVVGPASAVDSRIAAFDGTTGKLIKDAGQSVAGLQSNIDGKASDPHALGGASHSAATLAELNAKVSDATLDDASAPRDPNTHDLGGAAHGNATLAELNAKISDATLDDSGATRPPASHGNAAHSTAFAAKSTVGDHDDVDLTDAAENDGLMRSAGGIYVRKPYASKAEAEAGTAEGRWMSPLRTAEAIAALAGGGGGGLELLARVEYDPSTAASLFTTSTSPVDVDDANLAITFDAPASGEVRVVLEGSHRVNPSSSNAIAYYWGLREGTTDLARVVRVYRVNMTDNSEPRPGVSARGRVVIDVEGLTSGAKTLKWSHCRQGSGLESGMQAGGHGSFGLNTHGPAIMEVYALP